MAPNGCRPTDVWVPGSSQADHPPHAGAPLRRADAQAATTSWSARLKPGADWPAATAELESLRAWLRDQYPQENSKFAHGGLSRDGTDRTASPRPHADAARCRLDGVRRRRHGDADRVRQRRGTAAHQGTRPPSRDRGAQGARRRARTAPAPARRRRVAALGRGRRGRARDPVRPAAHARHRGASWAWAPSTSRRRSTGASSASPALVSLVGGRRVLHPSRDPRDARGRRRDAARHGADQQRPQSRRHVARRCFSSARR